MENMSLNISFIVGYGAIHLDTIVCALLNYTDDCNYQNAPLES